MQKLNVKIKNTKDCKKKPVFTRNQTDTDLKILNYKLSRIKKKPEITITKIYYNFWKSNCTYY